MSEQVAPPPVPDAAQSTPAAQGPPPAAVQAPPPAKPEAQKSGSKKLLGIVGAVVVFLVVAGLKFGIGSAIGNFFNKDETAEAKVGDCIAELPEAIGTEQKKVDGAKVVECTSTDAVYNVVGRVEGQTAEQARSGEACAQYLKADQDGYVFSSIEPGKTGYLLCLTKKA
ncbi:LppU/SCO3897 family protein [Micromonospora sp. KLBMP9576]|uniref:LppU/SCO3897 family protein n=1 Tax=Micromonospora sp. KLBMP9576 TaxID=3424769 RepID=UPI003D90CB3B